MYNILFDQAPRCALNLTEMIAKWINHIVKMLQGDNIYVIMK